MVTASLREFVTINLTAGHSIIIFYFLFQVLQQFSPLHITDLWLKAVVTAGLVFVELSRITWVLRFERSSLGGCYFAT